MKRREFIAGLGGAHRVAEFIRGRLREPNAETMAAIELARHRVS
jgi:hypothetical protein